MACFLRFSEAKRRGGGNGGGVAGRGIGCEEIRSIPVRRSSRGRRVEQDRSINQAMIRRRSPQAELLSGHSHEQRVTRLTGSLESWREVHRAAAWCSVWVAAARRRFPRIGGQAGCEAATRGTQGRNQQAQQKKRSRAPRKKVKSPRAHEAFYPQITAGRDSRERVAKETRLLAMAGIPEAPWNRKGLTPAGAGNSIKGLNRVLLPHGETPTDRT